jgi:hypothetical protein
VRNDREKELVVIRSHKEGPNCVVRDVEGIIYTNEAQPTQWMDEGSQIEKMREQLKQNHDEICRLADANRNLLEECDELKERLAKLEPKADPDRWWPDDVNTAPVSVIIRHIESDSAWDPGYAVRLSKLFTANDIKYVGELLRIGRRNFKKYRSVGSGSIYRIDVALEELYGIKGW